MKKKPFNPDKKDRLNPMSDTHNYAAGTEGEDILDLQDDEEEMEDESLPEDLEIPEPGDDDDDDEDEDEDEDII